MSSLCGRSLQTLSRRTATTEPKLSKSFLACQAALDRLHVIFEPENHLRPPKSSDRTQGDEMFARAQQSQGIAWGTWASSAMIAQLV